MTGSITRAVPNSDAFTISIYFMAPATLPDGSSITTLKTPAESDDPLDIRLRTKGVIDVKMQDGSIAGTSSLKWVAGQWGRCDLSATWDPVSGVLSGSVFLYLRSNGEQQDADSIIPFSSVTTSPTNYSHGAPSPDDPVRFEVERIWNSAIVPGPYGTPPPAPPLNPATTLIRPGVAGDDFVMFSVYTGDAQTFDTIGLNISASSDMSSPTPVAGGFHNEGGFNVFTITGLPSNTRRYAQATINDTPHGPVVSLKTTQVAGTPCTIRRAVGGCQQSPPASTACFDDIIDWDAASGPVRVIHLGDDTYPNTLTNDPFTHWVTYAASMADQWAISLAIAGIGINKVISDHDVNGGYPGGNGPNYNDPTTIASLQAWAAAVPAPMDDTNVPPVGRYWSEVEGNVRFVYLDQRNIQRTDVRQVKGMLPDTPGTFCIDPDQEDWLYNQATLAATLGQLLIVYTDSAFLGVSPVDVGHNWIDTTYSDKWPSYTEQRDRIDATLASIMPITAGHPNCEIWHSDSHALQFGVSANGIKVRCCGPWHQQVHAHYQNAYDLTYPPNTKGDSDGGGGNLTAKRSQYMRQTIVESPAGTWTVTAEMRECSTKVVGDTPTTVHTDTTVYSISGDVTGEHLYSLVGLPS